MKKKALAVTMAAAALMLTASAGWTSAATTGSFMKVFDITDNPYGAIGSDTVDDTTAIQAALNAANTAGGGTVIFPKGTYYTNKNLTVYSNTRLIGDQAKVSKVQVDQSVPANGTAVFVVQGSSKHVSFEQLWIENQNTSGNIGIHMGTGASEIDVKDNRFSGAKSQSVYVGATGVKHIEVSGNHFEEVAYGVLTNSVATDLKNLRIVNNEFINIYGDAIELNHPGTAYTAGANVIIADNYMSVPAAYGSGAGAGFGIGIAGATHVSITGNIIEKARYQAIHVEDEAKHISIIGNIINGVENDPDLTDNINAGIYVIDGDYITISGNNVRGAHDYGINLQYDGTNQATNATITGNTVTASGGGIKVSGEGKSNVIVSDNVVTGNTGHAMHLVGSASNLKLTDNIARDNGGNGLYIDGKPKAWYLSGNSLFGNTSGDIAINNPVNLPPLALNDYVNLVSGTVTSSYTPWLDAVPVGKYAEGLLYVTATRGTARATEIYRVVWDGTTPTITSLANETSGTISLSTPQVAGGKLQVRSYNSGAEGATVDYDVQFQGMIMYK